MKWNLRNRILVPTVALLLVISAAISGVSYWLSSAALEESMDAQLDRICTSGLQSVETWIGGQRQNITHWAVQPAMLAALQPGDQARTVRQAVNANFAHAKESFEFYENVMLADLTGATVACSSTDQIGRLTVADRDYFRDAAAGKTVISPVVRSRTTGNPIVVIATPVKDGGTVRGVLYGVLDLNWFSSKFVAGIKVLQSGYAFMFDEQGVFIAHPNKERILNTKLADFEWGAAVQQAASGEVNYTFDGSAKMARFARSEQLRWGLVATVSREEMTAAVTRIGWISLWLGLGSLAAGVTLMLLTARSIVRPIQQSTGRLSAGAEQITAAAGRCRRAARRWPKAPVNRPPRWRKPVPRWRRCRR
jgi:methyl-accepting chemotaxis protein